MVNRIAFRSVVPMTASALIHAGLVAAIVLGQDWAPAATPGLIAELAEPEAPPAVEQPAPLVPERRPVKPPRPITPLPFEAPAPPESQPSTHLPEPPVAHEPPKSVPPPPPVLLSPEPARIPGPVPEASPPVVSEPPRTPASPAVVGSPGAVDRPAASATVDPGPDTLAASAPTPRSPSASTAPPTAGGPAVAAIPADGVTRRAIPRGGYQYRPAYPSRARRLGIQGTTLLHVLVSEHGRVAEVIVKESAGHPDLDRAAADAVRRWQFEPARSGDDPVGMWVQLPFEFRLR
jgi:periplasmic protein TonB